MTPEVLRLVRALSTDRRVPVRAKLLAGAALGYTILPVGRLARPLRSGPLRVDNVIVLTFAVRHLLQAAGYDVVRERWTGTDDGFGWLVVLAGIDR